MRHPKRIALLLMKSQALLIFLSLICLGFVIWSFGFFSSWDGKSKLSVVSQSGTGDVAVTVYDPGSYGITVIKIPADTLVEAANNLGTWKLGSISKLGIDKNLGSWFLKNTVVKSFYFPIDAVPANLSILDKLKIYVFSLSIGNTGKNTIDLANTSYLRRSQLVDGSLGWQITDTMPLSVESYFSVSGTSMNVLIKNMSGSKRSAVIAGKVVEALGERVASVQNLDASDTDCKAVGLSDKIITEIAKVFSCQKEIKKPADNFDIEIDLGKKFTSRF